MVKEVKKRKRNVWNFN